MNQRNPVLLIHGINDTATVFNRMTLYLTRLGWSVHSLSLTPSNGRAGLDQLAAQVAEYAANAFAPDQSFDLVGFSMGGLVSRYYLQCLGGLDRVQRFITLASPHQGTWMAYGSYHPGCIQMRPDSVFLRHLNSNAAMLERLNFTSIWTPLDLMIVPANSSQMSVARDLQIWVPAHAWMVSDPRSLQAVATTLAEPFRPQVLADPQFGHSRDRQKLLQDGSKT